MYGHVGVLVPQLLLGSYLHTCCHGDALPLPPTQTVNTDVCLTSLLTANMSCTLRGYFGASKNIRCVLVHQIHQGP